LAPSETVIFDFEITGEEIVVKSPAEVRYRIMRNDDRQIVGVWLPSFLPRRGANLVVIDKQAKRFRLSQVYVAGDDSVDASVEGNCTRRLFMTHNGTVWDRLSSG
jgi:hypothetical protein